MNDLKDVVSLFITLFICVFDGYSMMNYRVKEKSAYGCFAGITLFCLLLNTFIILHYGAAVFNNIIIFTVGLPYLILILMITGDKVSQTLFNFWLWINVYGIISNFSVLINDYTFRSTCFLTAVRCTLQAERSLSAGGRIFSAFRGGTLPFRRRTANTRTCTASRGSFRCRAFCSSLGQGTNGRARRG